LILLWHQSISIVQQQAASFCEQYSKTKGAGSPQRHPFFLQLDSLIRRVQSTVEFENNIMFVFISEKYSLLHLSIFLVIIKEQQLN
jgi:hypothetical protein